MSLKSELRDRIKRRFGHPMIKVELHDDQIWDAIDYARAKFIKFAAGQATQEVFFTMLLSANQYLYDLPDGVTNVVTYEDCGSNYGSINTLFTVSHMMYEAGMFAALNPSYGSYSGSYYNLISLHIARQYIETLDRYIPDIYNFKYHKYANQLEVQPPPPSGNYLVVDEEGTTFDSPGWLLVRAYMIEGSTLPGYAGLASADHSLYDNEWIEDFATARCKEVLGLIRRKFASFTALGNQGTALDGGDLITEGKEEQKALIEALKMEETWDGTPILVG